MPDEPKQLTPLDQDLLEAEDRRLDRLIAATRGKRSDDDSPKDEGEEDEGEE